MSKCEAFRSLFTHSKACISHPLFISPLIAAQGGETVETRTSAVRTSIAFVLRTSHSHFMKVLLGITGCIAAYKAPELLRQLQKRGCEIHVVMTENAQNFVTATTLAALSRNHVFTGMFPDS